MNAQPGVTIVGEASVNYEQDLAELLVHVATTAVVLRMQSGEGGQDVSRAPDNDLLWLSDSLHNLDMLGSAILSGHADQVVWACDELIATYRGYGALQGASPQQQVFARARGDGLDPGRAMVLFQSIRRKALASMK